MKVLLTNLRFVAVLFLICSVFYTTVIWGIGAVFFPHKSQGSLIIRNGKVVGSELIGQAFVSPDYFVGRASAVDYNAAGSGGSNLAVANPELYLRMTDAVTSASASDNLTTSTITFDRVTASGSGLDPHITPENAEQQVSRVANKRHASETEIKELLAQHIDPPFLGFMGPQKVNVLTLNLALDKTFPVGR